MDRRGFLGRCAGCALASGCVASALGAPARVQASRDGRAAEGAAGLLPHSSRAANLALHQLRLRGTEAGIDQQADSRLPGDRVPARDGPQRRRGAAPHGRGQGQEDHGVSRLHGRDLDRSAADDCRGRQAHALRRRPLRGIRRVPDCLRGRAAGREERGRGLVHAVRRRADRGPLLQPDQGSEGGGPVRRPLHGRRAQDLQADG